jgi:threonine/homoserine/homoserine lactone efflux protein
VDWYTLAQFLTATFFLLISPGPVLAIIIHNTLRHGNLAGLLTALGVELGDLCLLGATFAALIISDTLLPAVFHWLSLAGALYLIWLAAEILFVGQRTSGERGLPRRRWPILEGLAIVLSNPTALIFYAAFFPQFIDPDRSIPEQMIVFSVVYVGAGVIFDAVCVFAVASMRPKDGWTRIGRVAELASAAVYLTIAIITILDFAEVSR